LGIEQRQRLAAQCAVPAYNKGNPPRRPPRLSQLYSSVRPFYFVTFNAHNRRKILADAVTHKTFRSFGERAEEEHGIAIGRYVLMPDHVHLFVAFPPDGMPLIKWVKALRSVLSKTLLNNRHRKPHWQEGFFDHVLRSRESYAQKWEYVRMNPVRAGLCATPEEWPYLGEIVPLRFE
jgi:putative transposase